MASGLNKIYVIFSNNDCEATIAKLFHEVMNDKDSGVVKRDMLNYLSEIVQCKTIPLVPVLRQYKITLTNAENAISRKYFMDVVSKYRTNEQFIEIVDYLKEDVYGILENISGFCSDDAKKRYLKYFNLSRDEKISATQECVIQDRLRILKWIILDISMTSGEMFANKLFTEAANRGRIEILEWLTDHFLVTFYEINVKYCHLPSMVAAIGELDVLKWIVKRFKLDRNNIISKENLTFRRAAKGGYLHVLKWLTNKFELTREDASAENNDAFKGAQKNNHYHVCDWLTERFNISLEKSPEQQIASQIFNSVVTDLVKKMSKDAQREWLETALIHGCGHQDHEIRKMIDDYCAKWDYFYGEPNVVVLKKITKIYDFLEKTYAESFEILKRICRDDRLDYIAKFLVDNNLMVAPEPKPVAIPTIEEFKQWYPDYIIVKSKDLAKYVVEKFV